MPLLNGIGSPCILVTDLFGQVEGDLLYSDFLLVVKTH